MARATKLAPSILSADFACLAEDVARVSGEADLLHVDVMDGHFVPNLTIGPPVVAALRARTKLFLDCHLMVDNPGVLLADFAEAGADRCIVHIEVGDEAVGSVLADLRGRRGQVHGTEPAGVEGRTVIHAEIPAHELSRYPVDLRSVSHGTGTFTRSFVRYDYMPPALSRQLTSGS